MREGGEGAEQPLPLNRKASFFLHGNKINPIHSEFGNGGLGGSHLGCFIRLVPSKRSIVSIELE